MGGGATKALTYPIPEPIVRQASGLSPSRGSVRAVKERKKVSFDLQPLESTAPRQGPLEEFRREEPPGVASPRHPSNIPREDPFRELPGGGSPNSKGTASQKSPTPEDSGPPPSKWQKWIQEQIHETPCWVREPVSHPSADEARQLIGSRYSDSVLSGKYQPNPPVRGPFGEAEIWVKPNAIPVGIPSYRLGGQRRTIHTNLIRDYVEKGKMEPGIGSWNLPSFPVQKANGKYRLVQDFRPLNAVTEKDGHPLPRIIDILHRQGQYKIWSKMDLVDGYHQMPLRKEHQHFTCSTTPLGVVQWKVLVIGHKKCGQPVPTDDGVGPSGPPICGPLPG